MFKLLSSEISHLVAQPESGMGYQVVEVATSGGQVKRGLVFNAELLFLDENRMVDRILSAGKSPTDLLKAANSSEGRFRSISVVSDPRTTMLSKHAVRERAAGAAEGDFERTSNSDRFYRFSAFVNDHRVLLDRSLSPGTYATTEADGSNVKTGAHAVERYALPNNDPASFRFSVGPRTGTLIQKGIVRPANGHQGGGVEVIFSAGTQPQTVALPPTRLPDK